MPMPREWGQEAEEEAPKKPYYPHEGAFVHGFLLPTLGREWSPRVHWCREWYLHPEAKAIFRVLWQSWEVARHNPTELASWWTLTGYPLWDRLTSDQGPFIGCTYRKSATGEPPRHDTGEAGDTLVRELPRAPLPEDLFDAVPSETTDGE